MRKTLQDWVTEVSYYFEITLSLILFVALIFFSLSLLKDVTGFFALNDEMDSLFQTFLGRTMALAIGVELIKMFSKPSLNTVIEVLLFALTRQLVVEHPSTVDFFIGVVAVALLFAVRKYLYVEKTE